MINEPEIQVTTSLKRHENVKPVNHRVFTLNRSSRTVLTVATVADLSHNNTNKFADLFIYEILEELTQYLSFKTINKCTEEHANRHRETKRIATDYLNLSFSG